MHHHDLIVCIFKLIELERNSIAFNRTMKENGASTPGASAGIAAVEVDDSFLSFFLFWSDIINFILISSFCNDSFPLRRRRLRPAGWSQLALTSHRSSQLTSFIVKKKRRWHEDDESTHQEREGERNRRRVRKRILSWTITIIITSMGTRKAFLTWLCYLAG